MNNQPVITYYGEMVSIDAIVAELDMMMRVKLHNFKVDEYAEAIKRGNYVHPLDCGRVDGELLLYDGFIRYAAYRKCGTIEVQVRIRNAECRDDVVLWAVQANAHEGLKRTNADKQRSVELLLATEKYSDMPATDVASAAGVVPATVHRYRERQNRQKTRLSNDNVISESSKTVLTKRGQRRPAKYRKRRAKPSGPIRQPPSVKMQWPTAEETGAPPPELRDQPHPDHPGLTYAQVFVREHGFVPLLPVNKKQQMDNRQDTRLIIGLVRDIGAICKELCAHISDLAIEDLARTLDTMESRGLWLRKLNQHRNELAIALPYIHALLDATSTIKEASDDDLRC